MSTSRHHVGSKDPPVDIVMANGTTIMVRAVGKPAPNTGQLPSIDDPVHHRPSALTPHPDILLRHRITIIGNNTLDNPKQKATTTVSCCSSSLPTSTSTTRPRQVIPSFPIPPLKKKRKRNCIRDCVSYAVANSRLVQSNIYISKRIMRNFQEAPVASGGHGRQAPRRLLKVFRWLRVSVRWPACDEDVACRPRRKNLQPSYCLGRPI